MKNYKEIFDMAFKSYEEAEGWTQSEKSAYQVLNQLSKQELLEMNEELDITCLKSNFSKKKCIDTIIEIGIQFELDKVALAKVCDEFRRECRELNGCTLF